MNRVLLTRLFDLVVVLFGVSVIVFLMIRLIPGDAVAIMLGANTEITPDRLAELNRRVGLDRPLVEQYLVWAGAALRGDFGTSLWTGRPVAAEILIHLWPTLELTFLALLIGAVLAVPVGCLMAQTRGGAADVAMRDRRHRGPHDPILLARHRDDHPARAASRPASLRSAYVPFSRRPTRQSGANAAACAWPLRFRSSPTCRAWFAPRCSMRWVRIMSAPPAPRA